jgi:DegV family protein with EDD domain
MSKISIITDSDSSLPVQIAKELDIIQVPILIQFGEQSYATGIDITDDLLFQIIDQKRTLPTTSAPSPNAFYDAFKDAFDLGAGQVICICVSSTISATYQAALSAAEMLPGKDITVVDSLNLTMAQGFIAIIAAEKVKQGANKAEVLKAIEETKSKVHVYGVLPTLKYLAMGGRMSKLAAGVADTLTIKPILTSRNGKLDLLEKVRTIRKAQDRLVELAGECTLGKKVERIAMIHTNNVPDAQDLFEKIKTSLQIELSPIMAEFSAGLSVHAGDGMIGFVILTD